MESNRDSQNANDKTQNINKPNTENPVTIEILKHRQLFNILRNPRALWKFIGLLLVLIVLIFFVLAGVSLIIKRYYPYNDINTNIYGATTLKNEDKDVTYWLFNTSEMWGNSGIHVNENDILTIRTSGAWHTAIHHIVDEAKSNSVLKDAWVSSDGGRRSTANDHFRSQFRISPNDTEGLLLMAVFPEKAQNGRQSINDGIIGGYGRNFINAIDSNLCEIYPIGRERINIRMLSSGVLHFSVNSTILTRKNIKLMYTRFVASLSDSLISKDDKEMVLKWVKDWSLDESITIPDYIRKIDEKIKSKTVTEDGQLDDKKLVQYTKRIKFGPYPGRHKDGWLLDNELIYYFNKKFCDAWFVDNLGSALIIIEHKNNNKE